VKNLGLAEEGVGYALDEHNRELITSDMETKLEDAKAKIIAGEIEVSDYYSTQ
jgi:basic membrane protein A and related proteins